MISNEESIGCKIKRLTGRKGEHGRPRQSHDQANVTEFRISNRARDRLLTNCSLIPCRHRLLGFDPSSVLLPKTVSDARERQCRHYYYNPATEIPRLHLNEQQKP